MLAATAPTSTTNITGFRHIRRGSSFSTESHPARPKRAPSVNEEVRECTVGLMANLEGSPCEHQQMLENRAKTQHRKERQRADDQHSRNQQHAKKRRGHRKCSGGLRHGFLARQISGNCQNRNHRKKSSKHCRDASGRVVPLRIGIKSGERRTVVSRSRGERVENLRESVRPGIADAGSPER